MDDFCLIITNVQFHSSFLTAELSTESIWIPDRNDIVGIASSKANKILSTGKITRSDTISGPWKISISTEELLATEDYFIVYMNKSGEVIGQSHSFIMNDLSSSPVESVDSFIAISDIDNEDDSYTIIDHNLVTDNDSIVCENWDMASSLYLKTSAQSQNEKIVEDESKNEPKKIEEPLDQQTNSTVFELTTNSSTNSSMSQSVVMAKEEHISQAKARMFQKHNKDLLNKVNKLSERLTEAKLQLKSKDEILKSKDEENEVLKVDLCEVKDELVCVKKDVEINKLASAKEIEKLESIIQEKDKWSTSLQEEVEFLSKENEKLKKIQQSNQTELKILRNEVAVLRQMKYGVPHSKEKKESSHKVVRKEERKEHKARHRSHDDVEIRRDVSKVNSQKKNIADEVIAQRLESLKKESAIRVCPICDEERPANEEAMALNIHIEECLKMKGFK